MKKAMAMVFILTLASCDSAARPRPGATARGVDTLPVSALSPERVDTLRDAEGEPYSPTYDIVALTRSEGVVAIDPDDRRIILFDSSGREQQTIGRNGAGPGEFRFPRQVFVLPMDSIAVWDAGLRRMSYFDATLTLDRTELFSRWEFGGINSDLVGRLHDGRWIGRMSNQKVFVDAEAGASEVIDTVALMVGRFDATPTRLVALPDRHGVDVIANAKGVTNLYALRLTDLEVGVGAICDSGVVLVDSGGVRVLDATGAVRGRWPLPRAGMPIRADDRKELIEQTMFMAKESPNAGTVRTLMGKLVGRYDTRMLRPSIDVSGTLWYGNIPQSSPSVFERVHRAGQRHAAVTLPRSIVLPSELAANPKVLESLERQMRLFPATVPTHIGRRTIVQTVVSEADGSVTEILHYAASWLPEKTQVLGHCYPSFRF